MGVLLSDPPPDTKPARLMSLDAYRGFVMLAMASGGFAFSRVAKQFPDSEVWKFLGYQFDHVTWIGCAAWDLIQPSFMFMVGVALPYSLASRRAKGKSEPEVFAHVLFRSAILIFLGIFLSSNGRKETDFTFVNVLTQIGLGYTLLYLLAGRGVLVQFGAIVAILGGYWYLFYSWPAPLLAFDYQSVGAPKGYEPLSGLFAHWNMNTNFAAAQDVQFLNWFPRSKPFEYNTGGYQTLNFVPSLATMIFGLMAGELLRSRAEPAVIFRRLAFGGLFCLAVGWALGMTVCPLVKRIWTPSWAVYSTGWTLLTLAAFYWFIDIWEYRRWAFPLVVVGVNSIAMYVMAQLMKGWVAGTLKTHIGQTIFDGPYGLVIQSASVLFVLWLFCLWMYRQKIFVKI